MKNCSKCGSILEPGATYCNTCFNKVEQENNIMQQSQMTNYESNTILNGEIQNNYCSRCGNKLQENSQYCVNCNMNNNMNLNHQITEDELNEQMIKAYLGKNADKEYDKLMSKKIVIVAISIIVGISILFFTGKIILNKYNEKQFNEKYKDYVFYDVEWYDESTNGSNIYEDIPTKRIELFEQYSKDENLTELNLEVAASNEQLNVKIKDGKLIYTYGAYEYESTNIINAKEILQNTEYTYGPKNSDIVVLTTDGDIYYSENINETIWKENSGYTLKYEIFSKFNEDIKNFDSSYKKLETNRKYQNIKNLLSQYDVADILVAESNGNKIFYDKNYNEYKYDKNVLLVGEVSGARIGINFDGTITSRDGVFTNLDRKIYFQKIYKIENASNSSPTYLMIDRQGYLYEIEDDVNPNGKFKLLNTPIYKIKKVGYKVEAGVLKSMIMIDDSNIVSEYNLNDNRRDYNYPLVFDSSLQLEKLLLNE